MFGSSKSREGQSNESGSNLDGLLAHYGAPESVGHGRAREYRGLYLVESTGYDGGGPATPPAQLRLVHSKSA